MESRQSQCSNSANKTTEGDLTVINSFNSVEEAVEFLTKEWKCELEKPNDNSLWVRPKDKKRFGILENRLGRFEIFIAL